MDLTKKRCEACDGSVPAMHPDEADFLIEDQVPKWSRDGDWIKRDYALKHFMACVELVRDIADLAEDEGHHPDLLIHDYKHLQVRLQTHKVGGLTENDFILAAKIERLWSNRHA